MFFFLNVLAGSDSNYYYYYHAKSTGHGKVYASTKDVFNPSQDADTEFNSAKQTMTLPTIEDNNAYQYIHLNAIPDEGYGFKQWRKVESFGEQGNKLGETRKIKSNEHLVKDQTYHFYYEADFQETMVSVGTASPSDVQVYIDKEINQLNDIVYLTASTKADTKVLWKKKIGNNEPIEVSNSNPLKVKVTEKAHYIAYKGDGTQKLGDGYYRIRTANPYNDDYYLKLADSWFNMTGIVGSARNAIINVPSITYNAQQVLKRDINLTADHITNPSTIVYLKNQSNNEYNLISQGLDVKRLTTGTHHGGSTLSTISYSGCYVNVIQAGDVYAIFPNIAMKYSGVSVDFGNYYFNSYFVNNKKEFSAETSDDSYNTKWFLEPINQNSIDVFYFSVNLSGAVQANGKYYTTLRLPFNCQIPSGSKVKAYSITGYPASGDLTSLATTGTIYSAGGSTPIPAGLPVVIECESNNPEDNKLMPIGDPSNYTSFNATSSTGETSNLSTSLYNKYGTHAHDDKGDQETKGDGVGYFSVAYSGSTTLYKLGVNENGVVGFWTAVTNGETIYGNQAYATQQCALFPKEIDLVDFPAAQDEITYKLVDSLTVAYVDNENNVIYAKDDNGAAEQAPAEGEEDFMKLHYGDNTYVGHSNWVAIEATSAPELQPAASRIEATGKVAEAMPNRRLKATKVVEIDREGDFDPNTYCLVNFMPKSSHSTTHHNFFFAEPQANEIARIIWAQWDASTSTFIVPPASGFTGVISTVFDLYNDSNNPTSKLQDGHQYQFIGLIKKTSAKDASNLYQLYPLSGITDHDDIITGVHNILTQSEVVSQKYYNTMGIESDVPFQGVNIVVTRYTDGTQSTHKLLK